MLVRWARSNVRENLVMISFLVKRFRIGHNGGTWVRLFSATQIVRMTLGEAFKVALVVQMLLSPLLTLIPVVVGCFSAAILPAVVHQLRYGGWFGWRWAIPYSFFLGVRSLLDFPVGALYSAQVQLADAGNAQPCKARRFPDNAHTSGQPGIRRASIWGFRGIWLQDPSPAIQILPTINKSHVPYAVGPRKGLRQITQPCGVCEIDPLAAASTRDPGPP